MQEGEAPFAPPHRDRETLGGGASEMLPHDETGRIPRTTIEWNTVVPVLLSASFPSWVKARKSTRASSTTSLRKSPSSLRGLLTRQLGRQ